MRILLFGGSGLLGQELLKLDSTIIVPTRDYININNFHELNQYVETVKPDLIINAAAQTNSIEIKDDPIPAVYTNIVGAANLAMVCQHKGIRLVYISTDYVYNGKRFGNHSEEDDINPENLYAWTKLGGECSVKCVNNHLIIRTSFGKSEFPYKNAFSSLFTSKDYVDVIAPMILKAAVSDAKGVINIGTERKTMYQYAKRRNNEVMMIYDDKKDFSLNTQKYNDEVR